MLQQHNFLRDCLRVLKEVKLLHLLNSVCSVSHSLNVDEVEEIARRYNLGWIVEKNTERTVRQFIAETVLRAEIYKLGNKLIFGLLSTLGDELVVGDTVSHCRLDFR